MFKSLNICLKDLQSEFRSKKKLNSMIIFSLLVVLIFSISFGNFIGKSSFIDSLVPGVLWVSFTFVSTIAIFQSFSDEIENGCINALKLCPAQWNAIYTGKILSTLTLLYLVQLFIIPIFALMFNYSFQGIFLLAVVVLVGTSGIVSVGVLLAAITMNTRSGELLLPVLLFPLIVPVIIPSVLATGKIISGSTFVDILDELRLLVVYVIMFYTTSRLLFEWTIQD
ncbi:heme exporter protein CcmB [Methanosalsum natronophilum]|uniref:Heme exporter protein B n=1 Tax=Methanosalsum natronophilum TaxID=768733 RepID=A0A424YYN9_9EURY|nr:heme exporter protein CcmB [Methanosalsum natronophilum]MCS3923009.1 heme exporter protein B [Methanosalsum natronophilum]RQD86116.1 MAG: heme ABC transporter permease [Methanosalsum natronophilum]